MPKEVVAQKTCASWLRIVMITNSYFISKLSHVERCCYFISCKVLRKVGTFIIYHWPVPILFCRSVHCLSGRLCLLYIKVGAFIRNDWPLPILSYRSVHRPCGRTVPVLHEGRSVYKRRLPRRRGSHWKPIQRWDHHPIGRGRHRELQLLRWLGLHQVNSISDKYEIYFLETIKIQNWNVDAIWMC